MSWTYSKLDSFHMNMGSFFFMEHMCLLIGFGGRNTWILSTPYIQIKIRLLKWTIKCNRHCYIVYPIHKPKHYWGSLNVFYFFRFQGKTSMVNFFFLKKKKKRNKKRASNFLNSMSDLVLCYPFLFNLGIESFNL